MEQHEAQSSEKEKRVNLIVKFNILKENGFEVPDQDKINIMNNEQLEDEYNNTINKIQKDSDRKNREMSNQQATTILQSIVNGEGLPKEMLEYYGCSN